MRWISLVTSEKHHENDKCRSMTEERLLFCEAKTFIIFYGRCFLQTTSNCTLQVSDHLILCFDVWQIFSIYERQINPSQWHSFFTIQKKLKVHKCLFSNFVPLYLITEYKHCHNIIYLCKLVTLSIEKQTHPLNISHVDLLQLLTTQFLKDN